MSDPIDQEIRILRAIFWSERDPEGRAFVPLADAYLRKGSPDEAISLLEDGLGRHPEFASAHMVAARAYRAVGARGAVHRALGSVLELDPGNASALRMKGELAESEGNVPIAITAFREAVERNPDYEDLPGRIERLAVGMSAVESTPDNALDEFDAPDLDFDAPGPAPDGAEADEGGRMSFPQDEAVGLTRASASADALAAGDDMQEHDPTDEGIERGSGFPGATLPFPVASEPDQEDPPAGEVLPGKDGLDDPSKIELGGDANFGIDDFPSDERVPPADSLTLESDSLEPDSVAPDSLVPDRLEFEPEIPAGARSREGDRRAGDLEVHESLLAERGPGGPEAGSTDSVEDVRSGDVDVIDPFGFEPAAPATGNAAASPPEDQPEEQLAEESAEIPAEPFDDPDDDAPDWRLPSNAEPRQAAPGVEPLPVTRTLGELYARQGLISQAVAVFEALLERSPDDATLRARLAELKGETSAELPDSAADSGASDEAAVSGEEALSGVDAFSAADQPIGSWFDDLLAWSPGAVPVAHLAPGAVPIESLAPTAWDAATAAPEPAASFPGAASDPAHASASAPESGPEFEPAPEPEAEPVPASEPASPTGPESPGTEGPAHQERVGESTSSPPADAADSSPKPREDGFEGLDDFQDWLRSLNR